MIASTRRAAWNELDRPAHDLRSRGVELTADGQGIRFRAPKGVLTPEHRAALVERKAEILAELELEAAQAQLGAVKARLGEMTDRLISLYDAGEQAEAATLHAEIRAVVDREWLPAIKKLALALHRVGRLPAQDEPLIADQLAAERGWRRRPDGWVETPERATACVLHADRAPAGGDLLFCPECRVRIVGEDGGSRERDIGLRCAHGRTRAPACGG